MKISELIEKLQALQERTSTEHEVRFTVKDHYTKYGHDMSLHLSTKDYFGFVSNGNTITITGFSLKDDTTGKHPKITFRA
jgi:hypothetical protein